MRQIAKSPAVEQVLLDEVEAPFHLALRPGTSRQTGPRFETVVGGEGQEARVVEWAVFVMAQHRYLHIVVQAGCGSTLKVFEGANVLADRRGEVLRLDKLHVCATRVTEDIAEE